MGLEVTINGITGTSPYDLYVCQPNGNGCFYISTITSTPYVFDIPEPYNSSTSYQLKVVDENNCTITGVENVI